jgi:hypothetical protein
VGGGEGGGVAHDLALAGEAVEDVPGAEEADAVVVLARLEGGLGLVAEFLVGDESVDAGQEGGLVDLDLALADVDLAVEDLELGAALEGEADEVLDVDPADGRAVEVLVDEEGGMVGALLFGPLEIEEAAEGDLGTDEGVPGLVELGALVLEADGGAQDVEAGGAAGVEEGFLARLLLVKELDGLLLGVGLRLVDDDVVDGVLDAVEDVVDGGAELDQGGLVLEFGDGDLLAVDAAGVEALADGELDGPEIAEALDGGVGALVEEIVVALLDAAVGVDGGVEGRLGGDDQALGALDVLLGAQDVGVAGEGELEAVVEAVVGG